MGEERRTDGREGGKEKEEEEEKEKRMGEGTQYQQQGQGQGAGSETPSSNNPAYHNLHSHQVRHSTRSRVPSSWTGEGGEAIIEICPTCSTDWGLADTSREGPFPSL